MDSDHVSPELLADAVDFFTSNQGFSRLLKGMIHKYQSLGRWGGSVTLTDLKEEERESLSTFFRKDFSRQKSITISLERFKQALQETRYGDIAVPALCEAIHGRHLITNAEALAEKEQAKASLFEELSQAYPDPYSRSWLLAIRAKAPITRLVQQIYDRDSQLLHQHMIYVLKALQKLHKRQLLDQPVFELYRLPVFAREITKDPHGFDLKTELGRLLINALKVIAMEQKRGRDPEDSSLLTSAEELTELYFTFGILRDDLWNFVTCTGLCANKEGNQPVHYLREAFREQSTLNLPLREVVKLQELFDNPYGQPEQPFKVFIVENSGVFSTLLDYVEEYRQASNQRGLPNPPLICTHGQFKLSGLLLLEKLATSGARLYYSGDFDPEGLLMVDRLLQRYPDQVIPWHYDLNAYHLSLSEQQISSARLNKLAGIHSPELLPVQNVIQETGLAGFQEGILDLLWGDILEVMSTENNSY